MLARAGALAPERWPPGHLDKPLPDLLVKVTGRMDATAAPDLGPAAGLPGRSSPGDMCEGGGSAAAGLWPLRCPQAVANGARAAAVDVVVGRQRLIEQRASRPNGR